MVRKSAKWTPQEDLVLKQLKEIQNDKSYTNWQIIAKALNQQFETTKTPKQCRERYTNCIKFGQDATNVLWSQEELNKLAELYELHGPVWSEMCLHFQKKSQNTIKNKFNNSMKRAARILYDCEMSLMNNNKKYKGRITYKLLSTMIKFSNQTHKISLSLVEPLDTNCSVIKFRSNLIKFTLNQQEVPKEEVQSLVKMIKSINCRIKSFGHFREKNKKKWKITQKNFESVYCLNKAEKCQEMNQQFQVTQQNFQSKSMPRLEINFESTSLIDLSMQSICEENMFSSNSFNMQRSLIEEFEEIVGNQQLTFNQEKFEYF